MAEPTINLVSQARLRTIVEVFMKGAADRTVQNTPFLNVLQAAGCIEYNVKGNIFKKIVQFDDKPLTPMTSQGGLTFANGDYYRELEFRPSGYEMTEAIPKLDVDLGGGENDYIDNIVEAKSKILATSAEKKIDPELFIDNTIAANDKRLGGLLSFHKYQTTAAGDRVALPNATETYGQKLIKLASEGGSWSDDIPSADRYNSNLANDWPSGNGDGRYDWNSPIGVNFASTKWANGNEFKTNCEEVLSHSLMWVQARMGSIAGAGRAPLQVQMGSARMMEFKSYIQSKYRMMMQHPYMLKLGIDNAFEYEGSAVSTGMSCPATDVFVWSPADTEFKCTYDKLYQVMGPEYDFKEKAWLLYLSILGRLMFSPRTSARIANFN